jgi:M6 family metalloprotease-like protein
LRKRSLALVALLGTLAAAGLAAAPAGAAATAGTESAAVTRGRSEPARACEIKRPPEGWPDGTSADFDTNLHSGIDSDWKLHVQPKGKVRALMLFVDFPNATADTNAAPYDNAEAYHDFLAPSVDWFERSSYGQFKLQIKTVPKWFRLPKPDVDYGIARNTFTVENQLAYVNEVVKLADPEVDFRGYDLLYIVPSRNARNIAFSPEFNDYTRAIVADRTVLKNGATFGQDMWSWGYKILNHETGHAISLPESYNASGVGGTHSYVGGWDIMGNISGRAPELMAWNKWKLGWLRSLQIGCVTRSGVTEHKLTPVEVGGPPGRSPKMVVVRTGTYTAWVAELRQNLVNDESTICDPGVLVYQVDASIPNGDGSIKVHDARPGSGRQGSCTELDIGTLGLGDGEVPVFNDPATGVTIELVKESTGSAVVRVTKN